MCKGKYWYEVGVGTDHWFYQGDEEVEEEIEVSRIVMAKVDIKPISLENILPQKVRETVKHRVAVRVSVESHDFIGDEINCREYLKYNPNRIYPVDQYLDEEQRSIEEENRLIQQQIEDEDEE